MRIRVTLAVLTLMAVACGDSSSETTQAVADGTIEVSAIDYAYVGMPDRVAAGSSFTLTNDSERELHELVAVRLPDDEERTVGELLQSPPEELEALFPLVATVIIAPPGESGFAVEGTGVLAEPGRYAVLCAIPTGADPGEYLAAAQAGEGGPPEVDGGPPHFINGMFTEVVVEG